MIVQKNGSVSHRTETNTWVTGLEKIALDQSCMIKIKIKHFVLAHRSQVSAVCSSWKYFQAQFDASAHKTKVAREQIMRSYSLNFLNPKKSHAMYATFGSTRAVVMLTNVKMDIFAEIMALPVASCNFTLLPYCFFADLGIVTYTDSHICSTTEGNRKRYNL